MEDDLQKLFSGEDGKVLLKRVYYFSKKLHGQGGFTLADLSPADVAQEAIVKTLGGERTWDSKKFPIYVHLQWTIRSIYANERQKLNLRSDEARLALDHVEVVVSRHDDFLHLRSTYEMLSVDHPELANTFKCATEWLLSGECSTDQEVADRLGISQSTYFERRAKIRKVVDEWEAERIAIRTETEGRTS
ncbi:hypothetical protein [Dinoroseobacter sp. S76]|uniref:hypothetical protein n=1 Tax=Dinoroseobacter sp. S76 TaxID=3415124 RepID=UPI003C7A2183